MKCNVLTELEDQFKQSTYRPDPENTTHLEFTYDLDTADALIQIERVVHAIIERKDDALFIVKDHANGSKKVTSTRLANKIILALCHCTDRMLNHFPIHEFNPYINVFIKQVREDDLLDHIQSNRLFKSGKSIYCDAVGYESFLMMATGIRRLVDNIRRDVQHTEFRSLIYSAKRLSNKNAAGLVTYIDSLFSRYDRLLVVRVDLSYHIGNTIKTPTDIDTKYQEAKDDFRHFLNNTKSNNLFKDLVGYVWKLEYGAEKGFHYHTLFFFNGAKVRKDGYKAMKIGEYWKLNITQGRGIYYNCNAKKSAYRELGIGMIKYNDKTLREGLYKAAEYLVKVDYYAKLLTPTKRRTFGRGEILSTKKDKRGRPRSYCSETA